MTAKKLPTARVVAVFSGRAGRMVRVSCPYRCRWGTHEHPWPSGDLYPSRESVAHCSRPGDLRTYRIRRSRGGEAAHRPRRRRGTDSVGGLA